MNTTTTGYNVRGALGAVMLTVLTSGFLALPAMAGGDEPLKTTVKFADLDITKAPGAQVLFNRIRRGAEQVCAPLESRELSMRASWTACIDKAISDAVATIHQPALFAVYSAQTGKPAPEVLAAAIR
jgi:UrcA family protein